MTKRDLIVLCVGAALGSTVAGQAMPMLEQRARITPVCVDIPPLPTYGIHEVSVHSAP